MVVTRRAFLHHRSESRGKNQQLLADALREAATDATNVTSMDDQGFGELFEIRFSLATDRGQATVLSAWITRRGEDFPRLVTCFIVQL